MHPCGCCARSKIPRKVENNAQVRVRIFYVFLVIFCSFGPHFVDSGHHFVEYVKNWLGSWLSGTPM